MNTSTDCEALKKEGNLTLLIKSSHSISEHLHNLDIQPQYMVNISFQLNLISMMMCSRPEKKTCLDALLKCECGKQEP